MKKKILLLGLGICLLFSACSGKKAAEEGSQPDTKQEKETEEGNASEKTDKEESGEKESNEDSITAQIEGPGKELEQPPEVTFMDYSQDVKDEESGMLLLSVTENSPVVSIPENEAAAEKINMAFEQKHMENQAYIEEDTEQARSAYEELSEEERKNWTGYGYGLTYKMVYVSTRILSMEVQSFQWQGASSTNNWTSAYCFDVTTGKLLSLADIFTDKEKVGEIAEKHILEVITQEPYKDSLMDDYESFVPDIFTEDVFYLGENGLMIICNPYLVTEDDSGVIEIEVPYEELTEVMNEAYMLK